MKNTLKRSEIIIRRRKCSEFQKLAMLIIQKSSSLDLATIKPAVSGPKRPQDRIELANFKNKFKELFSESVSEGGFGKDDFRIWKRS